MKHFNEHCINEQVSSSNIGTDIINGINVRYLTGSKEIKVHLEECPGRDVLVYNHGGSL